VYVSNGREGTVTPIATATNTPGLRIPVGRGPGLIAITQDGKTAYVTTKRVHGGAHRYGHRHAGGAD
jgi:DNA-binding beta-propeller fold protein YncE